jgi:hypothetical protein
MTEFFMALTVFSLIVLVIGLVGKFREMAQDD